MHLLTQNRAVLFRNSKKSYSIITGHMYFVPHTYMDQVDIFEDFILLLSGLNKKATPLVVNSFYIIDDAKQREKMTEEFYLAVKKEIAAYQEKCDYLIKSSSQSPASRMRLCS